MKRVIETMQQEAAEARARSVMLSLAAQKLTVYGLEGDTSPDFMTFEFDLYCPEESALFSVETLVPHPKAKRSIMKLSLMKRGNLKIHKSCGITTLPTTICPIQCAKCYAKKAERLYPATLPARVRHYEETLKPDFAPRMIAEILRSKVESFRPHESGDFYSQAYVDKWSTIAQALPGIAFYTYTKADLDFSQLDNLPNFNLIRSMTPTGFNFGDRARVEELQADGYTLCPCQKGVKIACMLDCTVCRTTAKVCFLQH